MVFRALNKGENSLLLQLPSELLNWIAELALPATLVALCRVSKLFNSLCTRLLYNVVVLGSFERMIRCCRTLSTNRFAAEAVRKLSFVWDGYVLNSPFFKPSSPSKGAI
jgi:hypothetical protein